MLYVCKVIIKYIEMGKSKTLTISLTDEMKQMAKDQSMVILGNENISGYFAYLLRKEHNRLKQQ